MNKVLLKKSELIKKFDFVLIFFIYQKKKKRAIQKKMEGNECCVICIQELNNDNSIIVCWNEHKLCCNCYDITIRQNTKITPITNTRITNITKCPFCRINMFDWFGVRELMGIKYFKEEERKEMNELTERMGELLDKMKKMEDEIESMKNGTHEKYEKIRLRRKRVCSYCREEGHNRRTCPLIS